MNALLLTAVLFASAEVPDAKPAEPAPTAKIDAAKSLDGNWMVVCYEKDGKPMPEAKDCQVMVKDNVATFTCKDDKNKIVSLRLECGEKGAIKTTEVANTGSDAKPDANAKTMTGVCVKTADYFAICVHPADADKDSTVGCTVVLKRAAPAENK